MATGRINQVLSEESTSHRRTTTRALNFKCQTESEHLIGKLSHAPRSEREQKSGFARATWFATHTLTSRPTKNAQSYWVTPQRCAVDSMPTVLECYAESFYTPSVQIQTPKKLQAESTRQLLHDGGCHRRHHLISLAVHSTLPLFAQAFAAQVIRGWLKADRNASSVNQFQS